MTINGLRALEARSLESYTARPEDLAIFRGLYAAYVLCSVIPIANWLPLAPRAFFYPPLGPAALFSAPPPAIALTGLNLLLAVFATMLFVGWKTGAASAGTGLTLFVLDSWAYSLGKINHDILLVVTPLLLGFSGWGRALSIDGLRRHCAAGERTTAWPLALLSLLIGFAMFTAGWAKVTSGWLDPQARCTYGHLAHSYLLKGRETWAAHWAFHIDSTWIWKAADWSTVALELACLPAVLHRRSIRLILAVACIFHLGVMQLFGIIFSANVLVYGAFVPFTELPGFRSLCIADSLSPGKRLLCCLVPLAVGLVAALAGESMSGLLRVPLNALVVWGGAAVGAGYLVQNLGRLSGHSTASRRVTPAAGRPGLSRT